MPTAPAPLPCCSLRTARKVHLRYGRYHGLLQPLAALEHTRLGTPLVVLRYPQLDALRPRH